MAPLRLLKSGERPIESLEQRLDREARERAREERDREPRGESLESHESRESRDRMSSELLDVPAAVVCLVCGEADCTGCDAEDLSRSGIVAIIAWERPGSSAWARLWATARSTTRDAESFFELLPDGPIMPALRFAALSELVAVSAMVLSVVPVALVVAPEWVRHLAFDAHARSVALRLLFAGVPAFAALMMFGHVAHGLSIDAGAVKSGARRARSRALRFGLYSCGWDLVMGPFGALVVAVKEGISSAFALVDLATVHTRATSAFLRGSYRLEGERAKKALGTASFGVVLIVGFAVLVVLASLAALVLA